MNGYFSNGDHSPEYTLQVGILLEDNAWTTLDEIKIDVPATVVFDKILSLKLIRRSILILYVSKTYILNPIPAEPIANSVDPDHLAAEEASWSGSALFAIKYMNLYQQSGSSNLIGWKLEMGMAS